MAVRDGDGQGVNLDGLTDLDLQPCLSSEEPRRAGRCDDGGHDVDHHLALALCPRVARRSDGLVLHGLCQALHLLQDVGLDADLGGQHREAAGVGVGGALGTLLLGLLGLGLGRVGLGDRTHLLGGVGVRGRCRGRQASEHHSDRRDEHEKLLHFDPSSGVDAREMFPGLAHP